MATAQITDAGYGIFLDPLAEAVEQSNAAASKIAEMIDSLGDGIKEIEVGPLPDKLKAVLLVFRPRNTFT
jgi:hypothetical protein